MEEVACYCSTLCTEPLTTTSLQNLLNKLNHLQTSVDNQLVFASKYSFKRFFAHLYKHSCIPELKTELEGEAHSSDFHLNLPLISEAFKVFMAFGASVNKSEFISISDKNAFLATSIALTYEHIGKDKPWSNGNLSNLAQDLLKKILYLHNCSKTEDILILYNEQLTSVCKEVLQLLQSKLVKDKWKRNPASMHVFCTLLQETPTSEMSECLPELFPPVLLLLDDYETRHKILGVTSVQTLIDRTSKTELRWFGRAEVLYEAVHHLLHTQDEQLLAVLLPCLLSLSCVLNQDKTRNSLFTPSKVDDTFQVFLTNMDFEDKWLNRRLYALYLKDYIDALGLGVIKYYGRLFKVIQNYLEISDYPNEAARLSILHSLVALIYNSWPRVDAYSCTILQYLIRLLIDVNSKDSLVTDGVKIEVMCSAKEVINTLAQVDKVKTINVLDSVLGIEEIPSVVKDTLLDIKDAVS